MKSKVLKIVLLLTIFFYYNRGFAGDSQTDEIKLDLFKVKKDLRQSYVGYDCEDFACGSNFSWILSKGRKEFAQKCAEAGVRVWRFAEMSRYSWRGELPTRLMLARKAQHHYKGSKSVYKGYASKPLKWWFSPESFWSFCRENNIYVIPMINAVSYYNPADKMAHCLVNRPKHYNAAADEAAAYLRWLKDNNYLDLAKVWEIGNESFICGWNPEEYAAFIKILIPKLRQVQPDIKLGMPIAITTRDNPDMEEILRRFRQGKPANRKTEWDIYLEVMRWSGKVIKALGKTAENIQYGVYHSYGAEPLYNSNIKGLMTSSNLLKAFPESRNWRLINTEWRDRSGEDGACHRNFKVAALWKAKFLTLMMAFPEMDYTCAHSIFGFSGGLYWSDGNWWTLQSVNRKRAHRTRLFDTNGNGKPRFDVGAFGPVAKMCNNLIDSHPLLLASGAELGPNSSALYYDYIYFDKKPATDLQWLISTNSKRDSIAAILINTGDHPRKLTLKALQARVDTSAAVVRTLTAVPGQENMLQIPGYTKNWQLQTRGLFQDKTIPLPPQSINLVVIPVELDKKFEKYTNRVKSQLPESLRGFSVSKGCSLELRNEAATIVAGKTGVQSATLTVPIHYIKAEKNTRSFMVSFEIRSNAKKTKCVPLIIGDKWKKIAAKTVNAGKTWKKAKMNFELSTGEYIKMFRFNIYNLKTGNTVLVKNICLKQK